MRKSKKGGWGAGSGSSWKGKGPSDCLGRLGRKDQTPVLIVVSVISKQERTWGSLQFIPTFISTNIWLSYMSILKLHLWTRGKLHLKLESAGRLWLGFQRRNPRTIMGMGQGTQEKVSEEVEGMVTAGDKGSKTQRNAGLEWTSKDFI